MFLEPAVSGQESNQADPFEGFEEAIKNSEVITIKKVNYLPSNSCLYTVYLNYPCFISICQHVKISGFVMARVKLSM